jgi:hypothetical protein
MKNSGELAAVVVGAAIGGIAGYLLFTERGRRVRRQIAPALEDFSRELASVRNTVHAVAGAANDGWAWLNEAPGEDETPLRPALRVADMARD